jgi:glycosyltransferase involved in cell wall biosynthesis
METSIIIRTKNEDDFEVIIVDSGSTDMTLEISKKFPVRIVQINPDDFSYPFALNVGCRNAKGEKYFVFLSAHSLLINKNGLQEAMSNFGDDNVLGVYGYLKSLPDATVWEKMFYDFFFYSTMIFRKKRKIKKSGIGVMGFTNAIIRRDLWESHNFDERYGLGGEDQAWADHWMKEGYFAIRDRSFSALHSHGLGLIGLIKQYKNWKSMLKPQDYREVGYRKTKDSN